MSRRDELQAHADELRTAIDGESDNAKRVALYRERRQTLAELDALTPPEAKGKKGGHTCPDRVVADTR